MATRRITQMSDKLKENTEPFTSAFGGMWYAVMDGFFNTIQYSSEWSPLSYSDTFLSCTEKFDEDENDVNHVAMNKYRDFRLAYIISGESDWISFGKTSLQWSKASTSAFWELDFSMWFDAEFPASESLYWSTLQ